MPVQGECFVRGDAATITDFADDVFNIHIQMTALNGCATGGTGL
jgi:hypothetical protein